MCESTNAAPARILAIDSSFLSLPLPLTAHHPLAALAAAATAPALPAARDACINPTTAVNSASGVCLVQRPERHRPSRDATAWRSRWPPAPPRRPSSRPNTRAPPAADARLLVASPTPPSSPRASSSPTRDDRTAPPPCFRKNFANPSPPTAPNIPPERSDRPSEETCCTRAPRLTPPYAPLNAVSAMRPAPDARAPLRSQSHETPLEVDRPDLAAAPDAACASRVCHRRRRRGNRR